MNIIYETDSGRLIQGDNVDAMKKIEDNSIDSCISDFPYDLSFMGKKWDTTGNFYEWCKSRAEQLHRIIKPGGYVLIFGHHKTNHRMKCAFEDIGFNIVEEIDWVYGTGFPKNQDIGKMFDKKAGVKRPLSDTQRPIGGKNGIYQGQGGNWGETVNIPMTNKSKQWDGWKTSGLKPAKEPITVFQKPLEGTYCDNIEKWNCGAMNIDACRIPTSEVITNHSRSAESAISKGIYHDSKKQETHQTDGQRLGRFPANIIFDTYMGIELDTQSGFLKSGSVNPEGFQGDYSANVYGKYAYNQIDPNTVYADSGGASRFFLKIENEEYVPFLYCQKPTKKEKGETNTHITVKPKSLIKWLIKLVTPKDGTTIDITAGSGTHGLSCEELNKEEGYSLKWINIEMLNTEKEPYCDIAMKRIKDVAEIA